MLPHLSFNHLIDHVTGLLCRYLTSPLKMIGGASPAKMDTSIRDRAIKGLARSVKVCVLTVYVQTL